MKTKEREQARILRRERGLSVKEIAKLLGVSRSSVSLWVRDVALTEEQYNALVRRKPLYSRQLRGAETNAARGRARRRAYQQQGRALARRGDPLHAAGCMLYWAEGAKNNKNGICFSNSDPELVRYFLEFLRTYFVLHDEAIRLTCNLFADHQERQREVEQFWLDTLQLPRVCLCNSIVNVYSKYSQKKRRNKLPYGTCKLVVHDTRVAQSIFGAIQEYASFEREGWLG